MGIKFRCPNGHKLHVKSFLAGKRGICPHCGVKVRIPEASVTPDEADDSPESDASIEGGVGTVVATARAKSVAESTTTANGVARPAVASAAPAPTAPTASVPPVSGTPIVTPAPAPAPTPTPSPATPVVAAVPVIAEKPTVAPVEVAPAAPASAATESSPATPASPVTVVEAPTVAPPIPTPAAPPDPILEAPNAVWYVRPPSGGQFGPARGDVMRKWIGEGRVSADSLVWRDGWADWKTAVVVFPMLAPAVPGVAKVAAVTGVPESSAATASVSRVLRAKKRSHGFAISMVVTLGLLALVLLAVFVYVLTGLNPS